MTKADLVDIIAEGTGLTKVETAAVVDGLFATMRNALKAGHRIEIRGFGRFQVVQRSERIGRNPKSGETVRIPAYKTVRFNCSKLLQDALNRPGD
ncbi:MAG: HU family DNA-binding protein [candidate division KSB1 bacterium]|nr:HU family DNA-binding protein [candidate division KSB1 bacterium]MDZ7333913.1 HU family DNA-binding protein [candidate division KSB1 bacterium]MDZ7358292.1 HU family DNA-binding protein [candidate division KSB1 bacterium]MDZ7376646.1 HU family DNA-binding protein [candidate division KSB1 bacterium]MDZ7399159.1 HU family DNA-binding protein [candidate division KSB1 bacterium]